MIRHWTHGHTGAAGVLVGLGLAQHVIYVFALGLILGGLLVYSSRTLRTLGRAAGRRAAELHRLTVDRLEAEIARKAAATMESMARANERVRRADEQAAAEKKAYIQGAIDAKP